MRKGESDYTRFGKDCFVYGDCFFIAQDSELGQFYQRFLELDDEKQEEFMKWARAYIHTLQ